VQKIRAGTKGCTRGVKKQRSQSSNSSGGKVKGDTNSDRPKTTFSFLFSNAGKIGRVIWGFKNTAAPGSDGIPVSLLKMGSDVLAGPISHLVHKSLATCIVPEGLKTALIHLVYKGGRKSRKEPLSYRPVAILCTMLKVFETIAKEELEAYMKANNMLPVSQARLQEGELLHNGACHGACGLGLGREVKGCCCNQL
jgi:hypothetical protein